MDGVLITKFASPAVLGGKLKKKPHNLTIDIKVKNYNICLKMDLIFEEALKKAGQGW